MNNNEFYLKINDIAKILNVSTATIRNWEKNNLFIAKRNKNNYRQYSSDDLKVLKKIKYLSIDKKLNTISIKKSLEMDTTIKTSEMILLNTTPLEEANTNNLKNDWKSLRKRNLLL